MQDVYSKLEDPYLGKSLLALGALDRASFSEGCANSQLLVQLGYHCATKEAELIERWSNMLCSSEGVKHTSVRIASSVPQLRSSTAASQNGKKSIDQVKHIVGIASGKGGVGKSTVATNLAIGLARQGAKVGLLDADIYGPSQGLMCGFADDVRPGIKDGKFVPLTAHGIELISMSFLLTDKTPLIWRGPMVSGALRKLLFETHWSNLDYLIVDLPPGTGDIHLTLAKSVDITAAIIVTTPQDVALLDAQKALEMFVKVDVPVIGFVENMSVHVCPSCGHEEHIFGQEGAEALKSKYSIPILTQIPIALELRKAMDAGKPVATNDSGPLAECFEHLSLEVGARIWEKLLDYYPSELALKQ